MKLTGAQYIPKGIFIYDRLKRTDKNALKIVCPGGIGDTIHVMRLAKEYLRINQIKDPIFVVKEAHQEILAWYRIKAKKIVLSPMEMRGLYLYMTIFRKYDQNHIFYAFHRRDYMGKMIMAKDLQTSYTDLVMHVPREKATALDIPFVECKRYKDTILLAPYSYSMKDVPLSFYQKLADEFTVRGYTVYSNVQQIERPLDHTMPLYLPLTELVRVAPNFRLVVSSRSGLCDALALCQCNLAVIYHEQYIDKDNGCFRDDVSDLSGFSTVTNLRYYPDQELSLVQKCLELTEREQKEI